MKILITGGSGMVGTALRILLKEHGHEVAILTRKAEADGQFQWNPELEQLDGEAIEWADAVVHLAGENIASGRWTAARKLALEQSRIESTRLLYRAFQAAENPPKRLVSASAVGFYGAITSDSIFTEADSHSDDFLGNLAFCWEQEVLKFRALGVVTSSLRMGVVVGWQGGALPKMALPFKMGMGASLAGGKQWMPWIGLMDLVRMFEFVLEMPNPQQVYNAVAPQHLTNHDFSKQLAQHLHRPYFLPSIPGIVLKLALGEMAVVLTEGSRVNCQRIQDEGFRFLHPQLQETLKEG